MGKLIDPADPQDKPLAMMFGGAFSAAVAQAKATHPGSRGSGASADDPIAFDPSVDGRIEIDMTQNHLVGLYPDRRSLKGYLLRNDARTYVQYVVFETNAGPGAIYYNVTRWAEANKVH